ncbi:MAG TPA: hypothetical protein VFE33_12980 [Thermoanaerobaculia bacterium]|nr:hypothetical protein [Thermoanaerobaculia bacterium]
MTSLLTLARSNVRRSFRLLEQGIPPFGDEVLTLAKEHDPEFPNLFSEESLSAFPVIYRNGGELRCAQGSFFGFYLLCHAIRSCLSAVNFQIGGWLSANSSLYGPASGLFYTAAYHALAGFLAAHGRVLVDEQTFTWVFGEEKPQVVAACLTKENTWKFEGRRRSHDARWLELKSLFVRSSFEIPPYFRRLFSALYPNRYKRGVDILEILSNPKEHRAQLEDHIDEFLLRIAEIRHVAIYHSFGDDPHIVDALFNREPVPGAEKKLGNQSRELGLFSQCLLEDATAAVRRIVEGLKVPKNVKLFLYLGSGQPWMDKPRSELWEPNGTKDNVDAIWSWLMAFDNKGESRNTGNSRSDGKNTRPRRKSTM